MGLCARLAGEKGARWGGSWLRSPSTLLLFLGEAALDAAEMVGAMKFLEPPERAAALGVRAASRGSFSFSPKEEERDLRRGEGEEAWWHPQPPLELELLCEGQSAGLKGLESALLRMAVHGLTAAGDGDGDLATAAISGAREREREQRESRRGGEERGFFFFFPFSD